MSGETNYAVATIRGGRILYCGNSTERAAAMLMPGTCYGVGNSLAAARADAERRAARFRGLAPYKAA